MEDELVIILGGRKVVFPSPTHIFKPPMPGLEGDRGNGVLRDCGISWEGEESRANPARFGRRYLTRIDLTPENVTRSTP